MKNVLNALQNLKKEVLNTQNDLKHVCSNFEFWAGKFFFDFSAEISAGGSKFLHFGGKKPFFALFVENFRKICKI